MPCFVKICGLVHASGVQTAVKAGADAVGFVFAESSRRVTPLQAALLASRVPTNVRRVAVMQHPDAELWREVETIFCPDVLQTDSEDFNYLDVPPEIERWPVVREGEASPAGAPSGIFVYEGRTSGRGEVVDWQVAAALTGRGRMILAGGLSEENVAQAIATVRPFGVDVSSAVESSPGVKDPELVRRFVAAARAAGA
jgi:phosphoribosylanthranilate isomerase